MTLDHFHFSQRARARHFSNLRHPPHPLDQPQDSFCPRAVTIWEQGHHTMNSTMIQCGEKEATAPCLLDLPNPVMTLEVTPRESLPNTTIPPSTHHSTSSRGDPITGLVWSLTAIIALCTFLIIFVIWWKQRIRKVQRVHDVVVVEAGDGGGNHDLGVEGYRSISSQTEEENHPDAELAHDGHVAWTNTASAVSSMRDPPPAYTSHDRLTGWELQSLEPGTRRCCYCASETCLEGPFDPDLATNVGAGRCVGDLQDFHTVPDWMRGDGPDNAGTEGDIACPRSVRLR